MEELAKSVYAFRFGPDDMFGGTKFLFDVSVKGGYTKIFGEPVSQMSDEQFRLLAGTYFLCDEVRELWKGKRERDNSEGESSPGLERRWVVYYAVGELLRLIYKVKNADLDTDLRRLGKPNRWMDDPKNATKIALREIFKLSCLATNKAYAQGEKQPNFRHRNWFRDPHTLTDINAELAVIPEYRSSRDLPLLTSTNEDD